MVSTQSKASIYDIRTLAKTIASFLRNKRDGLALTVEQLIQTLPNLQEILKFLPPEAVFLRFTDIDGKLAEITLKIYRSPSGEIAIYDAGAIPFG